MAKGITEIIKDFKILHPKAYEKIYEKGRAEALAEVEEAMYHQCFECDVDEDMQKWKNGYWIRYKLFENVMEQLKKQNNLTCFDCEHHFMSDCYLECNKHNRINDNKICDDFEQLKEQ